LSELARVGAAHGGIDAILVTHGHPDHDAGAARLRALTGAPVLVLQRRILPIATKSRFCARS